MTESWSETTGERPAIVTDAREVSVPTALYPAVLLLDSDGTILRANTVARALLGAAGDLRGDAFDELFTKTQRGRLRTAVARAAWDPDRVVEDIAAFGASATMRLVWRCASPLSGLVVAVGVELEDAKLPPDTIDGLSSSGTFPFAVLDRASLCPLEMNETALGWWRAQTQDLTGCSLVSRLDPNDRLPFVLAMNDLTPSPTRSGPWTTLSGQRITVTAAADRHGGLATIRWSAAPA